MPLAQLAYNTSVNETIGQTPFYANHGYHAELFHEPKEVQTLAEAARLSTEEMRHMYKELRQDIEFLSQRSAFHHNKHRSRGPMLKEGDKVYLLRKNIETTRPSKKLDHVKIGPFKIVRNIKDTSYELELPEGMKIYPVFHISLLEPAPANVPTLTQVPDNYLMEQEERYEVRKILDDSTNFDDGQQRFLVKWKGYPDSENTWEPRTNLDGCEKIIVQYEEQKKRHPGDPAPPKKKEIRQRPGHQERKEGQRRTSRH